MIKLRDHYFVAWLNVVKDVRYNINNNNEIFVEMTREEYTKYLKEYKTGIQPVLKKIRFVVKALSQTNNEVTPTSEKNLY